MQQKTRVPLRQFCCKFNACRQVFCFSNIRFKVSGVPHSSFPEGASTRQYPAPFCSLPAGTGIDNFKFDRQKQRQNLYRLTRRCSLYCCSETDIYSCFQKDSWKGVDCSRESAIFTFCVEFEIIGDSACWKRAENSRIQTDGCSFPGKVWWESGDFGMAVVKLKTGNPALRFTMELSARNASFHCESCF